MKKTQSSANRGIPALLFIWIMTGCVQPANQADDRSRAVSGGSDIPLPQYTLSRDQTHNKFSSAIPPVLTVPSGAVIEAFTEEASDGQVTLTSEAGDLAGIDVGLIHPLTGPVYIEGAEPGDILAVTIHTVEILEYGWNAIKPGSGFLPDEYKEPFLRLFRFSPGDSFAQFSESIRIPFRPFPGVMGVAPAGEEAISTIPPRANGGNMDNPFLTAGATVYFPVFAEGALFSVGDVHAAQGLGEVCGTAIESPARIIYEVKVVKNRTIAEPEYETAGYYGVTAFGLTLDEAAKKAVRYMIRYLVSEHGLTPNEAYALCSLAADLHIAEVVDHPHMLVCMHIPKGIFCTN